MSKKLKELQELYANERILWHWNNFLENREAKDE